MPKRPGTVFRSSPSVSSSSDRSGSNPTRSHKRLRSSSDVDSDADGIGNRPTKVYIVHAKLDEKSIRELFALVEANQTAQCQGLSLELCNNVKDATVIITSIRMKRRLERHVDWQTATQKAIVTPDWLRECVKQGSLVDCGDYAVLEELRDETLTHSPDENDKPTSDQSSVPLIPDSDSPEVQIISPPPPKALAVKPTNPKVFNNWRSKYACRRASPLICPNQTLAEELAILGRCRELEGQNVNALAYERVVAVSYPFVITRETYARDIVELPWLGEKTLSKIKEFIKDGYIKESRETRASERFQSLSTFAQIYGIGPSNARKLYSMGLRTVEDLERYYDISPSTSIEDSEDLLEGLTTITTPNGRKVSVSMPSQSSSKRANIPDVSIKIALALRKDFDVPIMRDEAEEIHRVVMSELAKIQPGCVSTVVGGHRKMRLIKTFGRRYRRGKPKCNDVDIVFSHSDLANGAKIVKGLCTKLVKRLHEKGLVTNVMHLSGFHAHDALRQEHWNSLETALTVFRLPPPEDHKGSKKERRLYHRLDLIFAAPEAYWTAIVGWSGSKMFERDIRLWAKDEKGIKFDSSGCTRRHDSTLLIPRSEQEVFDMLGLDWIDPTMRNA